jgi:hypothetical protein
MSTILSETERWKRTNELRITALSRFAAIARGNVPKKWQDNPIFGACDTAPGIDELGFKIIEIPTEVWRKWEAQEGRNDDFESEVAIIISAPTELNQCISEIHSHEGDVWLTGMGETYDFPDPESFLLKGRLQAQALTRTEHPVYMDAYTMQDDEPDIVRSLEPHGLMVRLGTVTAFLAVTCGQRFNNHDYIDKTVIAQDRCYIGHEDNVYRPRMFYEMNFAG